MKSISAVNNLISLIILLVVEVILCCEDKG
jgi:hypothetical protein